LEWPHWRQTITRCPFNIVAVARTGRDPDGKSPGSPRCWTSVDGGRVDCRP
jgi:hypothetical protein